MIDLTEKYRTKSGDQVKLFEILDDKVFGAYFDMGHSCKWVSMEWDLNGKTAIGASFHTVTPLELVAIPKFSVDNFRQKSLTKDVFYFGKHIRVPIYTKFIYTTGNGKVWASTVRPSWYESSQTWSGWDTDTEIGRTDYTGDIQDSVMELK